jgi:hypothetical protein
MTSGIDHYFWVSADILGYRIGLDYRVSVSGFFLSKNIVSGRRKIFIPSIFERANLGILGGR